MAGVWTIWLIPGLWPNLQFECFKRYLISQSITWPQTASVILVAGLHGFFCWLVIRHLDVGFLGIIPRFLLSLSARSPDDGFHL